MVKIKKVFCVGLTGGIASGKTTAARMFKELGIPIIDADEISHQLTKQNEIGYKKIVEHFGESILHEDNTINRKKLRRIIFQNKMQKKWLENLLHPLIRAEMTDAISKVKSPYCICVIPLLTESKGIEFIDRVLLVDTPLKIQIERAKNRDKTNIKAIQKIIDAQASHQARLKIADDILSNDSDLDTLRRHVAQFNSEYLSISK
ncbi:MAG: dephospho-CoA kinase [Gammaproteobacteria bacterium RIFCSPHIGHO2_12_FULL_38_11]|nr:MAG: dephospho-CoA kinase [Gammaproteobacteria bacterium RIFCSPHIGHO2_12_FULL_38_11]